jgi:hypothetical protein
LSDLHGNFGKNPRIFGAKCGQPATLFGCPAYPGPFSTRSFPVAFYALRAQPLCCGTVKFQGKEGFSPYKIPQLTSFFLNSLPKLLFILSPSIDLFNALSTTAAARKISPLKEASPAKVMSCALVAMTDLEKDLDAAKEVTGGAGAPSMKMAGRLANSPGRSAMVCGQSVPRDEGQSQPARQGPPCTHGHGTHPAHALSPRLTIGKEHRSVMSTCPTTGILTPRKMTAQHQLVAPLSSSDDDLTLVKHDAWVDLNPGGTRIRYT